MANEQYQKYKDSYKKYRETHKALIKQLGKEWRDSNKDRAVLLTKSWREKHPESVERWWRNSRNKIRYGNNQELALERDNWTCQMCGMSNEQHILLFNRRITVDHIDGNEENTSLDNLMTLCLPCHGRKDAKRRWEEKRKSFER